jgi:pilus assembly protein CpaB
MQKEIQTNVKQGAAIGGWICFVIGAVVMLIPLPTWFIYAPLFLAAFVLSIVALAQQRIASGITLLLAVVIGAPIIWVIAVALGLVTWFNPVEYERTRETQAKEHWIPIVVAREDIPARTKVTSDMVTVMPYPKDLLAPGAVQDRKEVEGRVTLVRLKAKEQIRASDLLTEGETPSFSYDIPEGMRAIAIAASEMNATDNAVKPGDHVDILATYSEPNTHQETTRLVLQNVLVLAVNQAETNTQGPTGAKSSMTLAVKPEEAELLMAADRAGVLRAKLRPP